MWKIISLFLLTIQISSLKAKNSLTGQWRISQTQEFINYDNNDYWYETKNGQIFSTFKFYILYNTDLTIYDESRKMFISISNDKLFVGYNKNGISNLLYNGKWIILPNLLKNQCQIVLNTLKQNDTFTHSLIIIKGKIQCLVNINNYLNNIDSSGRFIKITNQNLNNYTLLIDYKWPISSYHEFTAIVKLNKGLNILNLNYNYLNEKATLKVSVNYDKTVFNRIEPLHLAIFLTKDSPLKFDMDSRSLLLVEKNDLNSAIKRFQTIARLWQAFNSENLNTNNLGYKSFRLVEDSNEDIVINIIKSEYTIKDLWATDADHFNMIHQSITKDPLYSKRSSVFNLHVACLILDSHWDPVRRILVGHNALGGGYGGLNLGIFGSHLTHSWPENTKELIWRLTDRNPIDRNAVAFDVSPYKFKCFNVGVGAFLHETGHLLGLGHTEGIMHRGYDLFNRAFLSIEPSGNGNDFIPIKQGVDDLGPVWFKDDAVKLAKHETFSPFGNVKHKWNINSNHSFINFDNSTNWYEVSKDKLTFTFEFRSIWNTNDIILFAVGRNFYVKISNDKMYFGNDIYHFPNLLYTGKWVVKPRL